VGDGWRGGGTRQALCAADDVGCNFHVKGVDGKENAGENCGGRAVQHAAGDDGVEGGDCSVERDVDHVVAEGAQLVEVVVEAKGNGGERTVAEVRAWLKHVAAP